MTTGEEKTCYITKFFREKPDDPPQWLKIAQNIAFLQLLEKYKKLLECRSQPNFSDSNLRFS